MSELPQNVRDLMQSLAGGDTNLQEVQGGPAVLTTAQNERLMGVADKLSQASEVLMEVLHELEQTSPADAVEVAKVGIILSLTGLQLGELGQNATISDEVHVNVTLPTT